MGPTFAAKGYHFVAIDLPGHGSSMWNADGIYSVGAWAMNIMQAIDALGWKKCLIVAHSAGQGIATMAAGMCPERFVGCVCIDGFGMWNHAFDMRTGEAVSATEINRYYKFGYNSMVKLNSKKSGKRYDSFGAAVNARIQAVGNYPGNQTIKQSSAEVLTRRGTKTNSDGTVQFNHDVRANNFGTMQVLTLAQTMTFLDNLPPTLVLLAEYGFPDTRAAAAEKKKLLKKARVQMLDVQGTSHHLHMDEPERIAKLIFEFVTNEISDQDWQAQSEGTSAELLPPTDEFFAGPAKITNAFAPKVKAKL
jgi:pimeloyl-ACP methyl ester carboxylesterase